MIPPKDDKKNYNPGAGYKGGKEGFTPPTFNIPFQPVWIIDGINQHTVDFAEKLGQFLSKNGLTTSQIRNVFGEIKRIQIKGFEKEKSSFVLLKPKMAYAAARVDKFKSAGINELKKAFDQAHSNVTNHKSYQNFVDFFEAILAYHKASGGKDN